MTDRGTNRKTCFPITGQKLSRLAFLKGGALWLLSSTLGDRCVHSLDAQDDHGAPLLRIGLLTDLHYADRPPAGTRFYRDTLSKLRACVDRL